MMDSKTQDRIRSVVNMYSDRMHKQLYQIYSLHHLIEDKKKQCFELDKTLYEKQGYIHGLDHKREVYIDLNNKMSYALDRLRLIIQHAWKKLEEVEEQIKIKNTTLVELDEKISRKRKRVEEIDQFVNEVLV